MGKKKKRPAKSTSQRSTLWLRLVQGLRQERVKFEFRSFHHFDYLVGIIVFWVSLFVYLRTLTPNIDLHDSGDMITSAYSLGISHPPGYPLYCLLGKLWLILLPLANIAYRMNLASALSASLAVMMVYFIILKLSVSWQTEKSEWLQSVTHLPSIAGAFMFCFATTFWQQAVIAEKYTLNALFASLIIFILIKWEEIVNNESFKPSSSPPVLLLIFSFILGLSFTHHLQTIFLVPASAFLILWLYYKTYHRLVPSAIIVRMAICFFIPLILYIYLPIRASFEPVVNWGCPNTLERFINHITVKEYSYYFSASFDKLMHRFLIEHPRFFLLQFTPYSIWLCLPGIILLWRMRRNILIFLGLVIGGDVIHSIRYGIHNIEDYYIPGYLITSVWIGCGIGWLTVLGLKRLKLQPWLVYLTPAFGLIFPIISFASNYYYGNHRDHYYSYDYGSNILQPLKENSILYIKGDTFAFPLWYLHYVENIRQDVIMIDQYSLHYDWYAQQVKHQNPQLKFEFKPQTQVKGLTPEAERIIKARFDYIAQHNPQPIYLPYDENIAKDYCLVPEGISHRLLSQQAARQERISVMDNDLRFVYRYILDKKIYKEERVESNISNYATAYNNRGKFYQDEGMYEEAINEFKKALLADPARLISYYNLGMVYKDQGNFGAAIKEFNQMIKIDPKDAKGYYGLALSYHTQNQIEAAIKAYKQAGDRDPDRDFIWLNLGNAYISKRDYAKAIDAFSRACQVNPQGLAGYYNLGVAYTQAGNRDQAIAAYKRALSLDPNYEPAKNSLAALGERI